jgi:tRNA threonylcarbamoyl adenosine modification protein (Sua5/YciO/YrdC/YwlC family)
VRLQINPKHPEPRKIERAVHALRQGEVIGYPTDTVYGLGCDIHQKKAVDRVYQIKGMDRDQPLAFLCPDLSDIARFAQVDDRTYRLMRRLTPGPFTFILNATREVPRILMMKRKQVGIRVPDHPVAQALLRELGNPIVSTSASVDGEPLHDPEEIDDRFPGLALVLDVDVIPGESSTVVDMTGREPVVTRQGAGQIEGLSILNAS